MDNKKEENCIFCKISSKEIPSSFVYEDENFYGFLDISPVTKGHTLLIPKTHHVWMHEVPDELLKEAFVTTKKIMKMMIKGLPCDYVQVVVVGKDVPHFHIHLMPRKNNDNLPQFLTTAYDSDEEKNMYAEKIKNAL